MKNTKKTLFLLLLAILVSGCTTAIAGYSYTTRDKSAKASKKQQEEVKNQVMKLLEKEYKQPFKLESFEYKYEKFLKLIHRKYPSYWLVELPFFSIILKYQVEPLALKFFPIRNHSLLNRVEFCHSL